jgi:hypothetical protein
MTSIHAVIRLIRHQVYDDEKTKSRKGYLFIQVVKICNMQPSEELRFEGRRLLASQQAKIMFHPREQFP